jgi:hypothetical protein
LKKASKRFFFEKKKQKTFLLRAWGYGGGSGKTACLERWIARPASSRSQ